MPTRRKVPLPSANGGGAGNTYTFDLPTDRRYHMLKLFYTTATVGGANQVNMEAEIDEVRINIGGKPQRRFNGKELFDINTLNGKAFVDGILPIYFSEPWRRNEAGEDSLAWGMSNVNTFQIEVDINPAAGANTLAGISIVDDVQTPLQGIIKWRKFNVPIGAVGLHTLSTLPKIGTYQRMHCFETAAADIADVEVSIDQLKVYDMNDAENTEVLGDQGLSPVADVFHIIFDETQRVQDGLPMVKRLQNGSIAPISEFQIDFNMAVANPFNMITEILGNPD